MFLALQLVVGMSCATADVVKLKNGSSFDGRVLDENDEEVTISLNVGEVTFKKDEVAEVTYATEEQNQWIESHWAREKKPKEAGDTETENKELVEQYLNQGKVKYEGRWITQEAYDVIQREKDVKQKRLRFLAAEKKRTQEREREERQEAVEGKNNERPFAQTAPVSLSERYHKIQGESFGSSEGTTIATTSATTTLKDRLQSLKNQETVAAEVKGMQGTPYGGTNTTTVTTVDNDYAEKK